jgi:DNA-binding GntR family transcriptional regulator
MPPRHKVVAHLIQRSIAAGDFTPGQLLPPEEELAQRYGASPDEVRLAVAHLRSSGLISPDDTQGAAVSDPPTQTHFTSAPASYLKPMPTQDSQFRDSASDAGLVATQRVETEVEAASAAIADRLGLELRQQVLRRRTVRLADAVPVALEDTYYPWDLVGTGPTVTEDINDEFLHGLGWKRVGWEDAITARGATDAEAALLGLDGAMPVVERTRVRYAMKDDAQTRPVSYTQSVLVGARNRLIYSLKQADLPHLDEAKR